MLVKWDGSNMTLVKPKYHNHAREIKIKILNNTQVKGTPGLIKLHK